MQPHSAPWRKRRGRIWNREELVSDITANAEATKALVATVATAGTVRLEERQLIRRPLP